MNTWNKCMKILRSRPYISFIAVFILSALLQGITWKGHVLMDDSMWGNQTKFVLHNDTAQEFDFGAGYGHPGGPVIEGTAIIHGITRMRYDYSVDTLVVLFNSFIITLIYALCCVLKKDRLWGITAVIVLSLNWLYKVTTPPSAMAATLFVLLCLLTLYIYEQKKQVPPKYLWLWGLAAGMIVATRIDIGTVSFAVLLLFLWISKSVNWKKMLLLGFGSFGAFVLFNPFMWFMPIQHVKDLIHKVTYHYADFAQINLSAMYICSISSLAFMGIAISIFFAIYYKKIKSPIASPFIYTTIALTVLLHIIFFTSRYKAERYFVPMIFFWEIILPLYVFTLLDKANTDSVKLSKPSPIINKWHIILLLVGYSVLTLLIAL